MRAAGRPAGTAHAGRDGARGCARPRPRRVGAGADGSRRTGGRARDPGADPALPYLVLCGPGNNGGDGYVAARLLAQQGWPVAVAALASPRAGSDAAAAAARWHGPTVPFQPEEAARASLAIDAVFGAGLARDVGPEVAAVLAAAPRIVAIDVPSGIDGATGAVRGFAPAPPSPSPSSAASPAICCCQGARGAAKPSSPISACPPPSWHRSVPRPSPTAPPSGPCRAPTPPATNTPADTSRSWAAPP